MHDKGEEGRDDVGYEIHTRGSTDSLSLSLSPANTYTIMNYVLIIKQCDFN